MTDTDKRNEKNDDINFEGPIELSPQIPLLNITPQL